MEPIKITFLKRELEAFKDNGIKNIEISAAFLREAIEESREFLAHDPLDILVPNFDRDKERLGQYLKVNFEMTPFGPFQVLPKLNL